MKLLAQQAKVFTDEKTNQANVHLNGTSRWLKRESSGGCDDWAVFKGPDGTEFVGSKSSVVPS
eukprot:13832697-Alexandrium_andersonii.AAC.1